MSTPTLASVLDAHTAETRANTERTRVRTAAALAEKRSVEMELLEGHAARETMIRESENARERRERMIEQLRERFSPEE